MELATASVSQIHVVATQMLAEATADRSFANFEGAGRGFRASATIHSN